jgi:translation initiation factor 4A
MSSTVQAVVDINASDANQEPIKTYEKWDDMDIPTDLLRGVFSYGFDLPSEIQKKAIMPIVSGRDVLIQAQSGSGKTGTFTIGALSRIDVTEKTTQALILAPTHELAKQITRVVVGLGSMLPDLTVKTLIGGTSVRDDIESMESNVPHVIVGCTGRVCDLIYKRHIDLSSLRIIVLDEADEMLSQGFGEQIQDLFKQYISIKTQVALFSATMPPEMVRMTQKMLQNPVRVRVNAEELSLKGIQQYYIALPNDDIKYDSIKDLFSVLTVSKCIIYCNSVKRVERLAFSLDRDGFSVCSIHGSMSKEERNQVFELFRTGDARLMVSSDITARGIDIQQVSTVVNFDVPHNVHTYLHRIGRGGRWGRKGYAINLVTPRDIMDLRRIESQYTVKIEELPSGFDGKT